MAHFREKKSNKRTVMSCRQETTPGLFVFTCVHRHGRHCVWGFQKAMSPKPPWEWKGAENGGFHKLQYFCCCRTKKCCCFFFFKMSCFFEYTWHLIKQMTERRSSITQLQHHLGSKKFFSISLYLVCPAVASSRADDVCRGFIVTCRAAPCEPLQTRLPAEQLKVNEGDLD